MCNVKSRLIAVLVSCLALFEPFCVTRGEFLDMWYSVAFYLANGAKIDQIVFHGDRGE